MNNKISNINKFICTIFVVSLIFCSRAFELLELPFYYFIEVGVLGGIVVSLILIVALNRGKYIHYDKKILFTVIITIVLNLFSPVMANINFGQDIIIGLLAFRVPIFAAIIYFLFYGIFLSNRKDSNDVFFENIISKLFIVSLFITLLWIYLTYTLNAEYYYFSGGNLLVDTRSDGSYRFRFDIFFPFMLLCCSWYRIYNLKKKKIFYWLTLFLALVYIVFYFQGRVFIGAIGVALFLCYIRSYIYSTRYIILYFVIFTFVILSIIIYFTYGELIDLYQSVLTSFSLADSSSLVRLRILRVMENNFVNNFLFGNGYLSNQSDINAGDTKFSPLDIGVLGVVYTYGFLLFIIAFSWFSKLWLDSFSNKNTKLYSFAFTVLFVNMIFTGTFFFRPYQIMVLLLFYMVFNYNTRLKNNLLDT